MGSNKNSTKIFERNPNLRHQIYQSFRLHLVGYSNYDFDGDKENGVSTSCYLMNLGSTAISWRSCKQSVPFDSTIEAEYVAVAQATKEIIWLWKILEDLQEKQKASTLLFVDNSSAIQLAKNPKFHD